jgi:hypothetical protein
MEHLMDNHELRGSPAGDFQERRPADINGTATPLGEGDERRFPRLARGLVRYLEFERIGHLLDR